MNIQTEEFIVDGIVLKTILGYEDYIINEDGTRCWSKSREVRYQGRVYCKAGRWLRQGEDEKGYPTFKFAVEGYTRRMRAHVLVARAWIGPPPFEDAFVLHRDDIKKNCHYNNLYYGTQVDNMKDRSNNGYKAARGSRCGSAKLNEERVLEIKRQLNLNVSKYQLAREYKVSPAIIYRINDGSIWSHVILEQ